ncbi:hypothetical protein RUND412_001470 [Rhizina undulata]
MSAFYASSSSTSIRSPAPAHLPSSSRSRTDAPEMNSSSNRGTPLPYLSTNTNVTTSLLIPNLHCSSCCTTIVELLSTLSPAPITISTSIIDHKVTVSHSHDLPAEEIVRVLLTADFEVDSINISGGAPNSFSESFISFRGQAGGWLDQATTRLRDAMVHAGKRMSRVGSRHIDNCEQCREQAEEEGSKRRSFRSEGKSEHKRWSNRSEKKNVAESLSEARPILRRGAGGYPYSEKSEVRSWSSPSLTSGEASNPRIPESTALGALPAAKAAYTVVKIEDCEPEKEYPLEAAEQPITGFYQATVAIDGMTCAACSSKINEILSALPYVTDVTINLMNNSGVITFDSTLTGTPETGAKQIVEEVENCGYDGELQDLQLIGQQKLSEDATARTRRTVDLKIRGMYCEHCPGNAIEALEMMFPDRQLLQIERKPTVNRPIFRISYYPDPPNLTLRHIAAAIEGASPDFTVVVHHPPTLEERSRKVQLKEQRILLLRLALCITIAIPTFLIGIVWMTLVPKTDRIRLFFEEPMWAGSVSRTEWALFFLSTPVMFFVADVFHLRAIREIRASWRRGSSVPILRRFYRFGSMNLLISLGVSISYFASVALLGMAAVRKVTVLEGTRGMEAIHTTTYFDSTVFLTMFLLMGKCLEGYSKTKTADAISMLGKLRPTEAVLVVPKSTTSSSELSPLEQKALDEGLRFSPIGEKDESNTAYSDNRLWTTHKIHADMLEVGDIVSVVRGSTPPADGTVVSGNSQFDESSLTGESRLVPKAPGDVVYAGTVNQGHVINVRVDGVGGTSMLDQIVKVVREGQARRAPIERLADIITGYFVPVVTLIAVLTWIIWLSLGLSGALPQRYLDVDQGGWPVWSLGFAIAVFVIACPCGIGLAAPTALFVGSGLAAKYGILAKGGGEAFQEASCLDVVVFDKTGTLTHGDEPSVTDEVVMERLERKVVFAVARKLEEASAHPLARAVVGYLEGREGLELGVDEIEEIPGRGLRGRFLLGPDFIEGIIGNEKWMEENGVFVEDVHRAMLTQWKLAGKSVILLAIRRRPAGRSYMGGYRLVALYAAADPLRPEAARVVQSLKDLGIGVWMISGDNTTTAIAVGAMVGIPPENIIAGVLPTEKAERIQHLQRTAPLRPRGGFSTSSIPNPPRAIVAMVGDGINDAPALSMADVGIAIGSGSDIAIGSAKFILMNSNLNSLITLIELSRKVFRRVKFNFLWACIYNICALPVAAGVFYPAGGVRLNPVWAALAMALSSVSVVGSSLMLKSRIWGVGFRDRSDRRNRN